MARRVGATPTGQVAILGFIFLFIFTAYMTIQGFAPQLYGDVLASNMESTLYGTFTIACFVAPAVTNKLGPRLTLFLGALGYAALVAASLLLAVVGADWCRSVVILGGAILGVGAALLWTAQGRLMLEYSDGTDQGRLFAIFWALFNMSSVAGGFLTFFYFSRNSEAAPWPLYIIFLGCIVVGGAAVGLLSPAHQIVRTPPAAGTRSLTVNPADACAPTDADANAAPPSGGGTQCVAEAVATLRLFGTRRMALLAPLFWYTGFNQPYQLNTFGNRFFSPRALGIELAAFYAAEVVGGFLAGWMLDSEANPRRGAMRQLLIFAVATFSAYALSLTRELPAAHELWPTPPANATQLELDDELILAPTAAFFLWGLSDSQVQAYAYWLIRQLHTDGDEMSRAVGFYKMVQSLGWSIGFVLVPASRLPPLVQNLVTAASAVLGIGLALLELPPSVTRKTARRSGCCGTAATPLLDDVGP